MARLRTAILISGRGSNMQALVDAAADPAYPAEIVRVISNVPGAGGLERAAQTGITTTAIDHRDFDGRAPFEDALHAELTEAGVELVCLAGFMRLLTEGFVERWFDRMLNIHPSMLPAYKGLHTHERVLSEGVRFTRLHGPFRATRDGYRPDHCAGIGPGTAGRRCRQSRGEGSDGRT